MFTPLQVSCVICHVSHVICHMSRFRSFSLLLFSKLWRVCYQRGLHHLVFLPNAFYCALCSVHQAQYLLFIVQCSVDVFSVDVFSSLFSIQCSLLAVKCSMFRSFADFFLFFNCVTALHYSNELMILPIF